MLRILFAALTLCASASIATAYDQRCDGPARYQATAEADLSGWGTGHACDRARASGVRAMVDAAAMTAGVPSGIAHAVIRQESNYNPALRGRAGEWGIGQIKCQTARGVGMSGSCGQLADAATNLRYSMAYLRLALNRGGHGCAGVSLYQRGIGGRASCSRYGRAVMARAGR